MTDDARIGVIGLMPLKGMPIAAAYDDTVKSHQRLAGLPDHGRHNVSHELSWRFQYDLSHSLSDSRVQQSPGVRGRPQVETPVAEVMRTLAASITP
jgi:hypothetical protein